MMSEFPGREQEELGFQLCASVVPSELVCAATACVLLCCSQVAHVGDALADTAAIDGGAAGIIVDLFADGQLIPQLTQVSRWVGEWLAGLQQSREEKMALHLSMWVCCFPTYLCGSLWRVHVWYG